MKLKIIDLIFDLSNHEVMSKFVKLDDEIYEYNHVANDYESKINGCWLFKDVVFGSNGNRLNTEVEIVTEEETINRLKKLPKVAIGFDNIQEDDMGWTYIEEDSCKYYISPTVLNRLTSLADAVNYLLEKEGE